MEVPKRIKEESVMGLVLYGGEGRLRNSEGRQVAPSIENVQREVTVLLPF